MTHDQFSQKLQTIPDSELAEMAQKAVNDLAKSYGKSFKMSIPPQKTDTDMVLSEVIRRFSITFKK